MSVDYCSALIYGFDCSDKIKEISYDDLDLLEEIGWDIIRDGYSDKFLYIGITISRVDCYQFRPVDIFKAMTPNIIDEMTKLRQATPENLNKFLPLSGSLYHLCYAT